MRTGPTQWIRSPVRLSVSAVITTLLFLSGTALADDTPIRTYFIGNSVTDTIRYGALAKLAASRGHTLTWGRDMIPGAPLSWLWDPPRMGSRNRPLVSIPKPWLSTSGTCSACNPSIATSKGKTAT